MIKRTENETVINKPIRIQINGDLILKPLNDINSQYEEYELEYVPLYTGHSKTSLEDHFNQFVDDIYETEEEAEYKNDIGCKKEYNPEKSQLLEIPDILNALFKMQKLAPQERLKEIKKSKGQVDWKEVAKMIMKLFSIDKEKKYSSIELFEFFWEDVYFKDESLVFDQVEVLQAVNRALDYLISQNFLQTSDNKFYLAKPEKLTPGNKMASKQAVRASIG